MRRKYGIWLLPSGESRFELQHLIDNIAEELGSVKFIPHISIAGFTLDDNELDAVKGKIEQLAKQHDPFNVTMKDYGFKDERHRSLYLLADSQGLEDVYQNTSLMFPEAVQIERNKEMPHLSVAYGDYSESTKMEIIKNYPQNFSFEVRGIDLCIAEGSEDKWHSIYRAEILK